MASYVVIGGGQAGLSCVSRLRELDSSSSITLLCSESVLPYSRPPLSKDYLSQKSNLSDLLLRPEGWYDEHDITVRLSSEATSIDCSSRCVRTSDDQSYSYDSLLLATGSRPRLLPFASSKKSKKIRVLRSVSDSDLLSSDLRPDSRLAILGGGYIGLEVASVAVRLGMSVTIIEKDSRLLGRVACEQTSDYFLELHKSHGVEFIFSESITDISDSASGCDLTLSDGSSLTADCVLCGIGITPETSLAEASGLAVNDGIEVDSHCRTSDSNIYAAGDCCSFLYDDLPTRFESVPHAIHQGSCAAENMVGGSETYVPHPWFWSDQYDKKLQIAGLNRGYDSTLVRESSDSYSVFYYRGDEFLAVDAVNDATTFMVCRRLLEAGHNLPHQKISNPNFNLRAYAKEVL